MENSNKPAYPTAGDANDGLTKREHIAALCLQGLLANPEMIINHKEVDLGKAAVRAADGLLKELEKQ